MAASDVGKLFAFHENGSDLTVELIAYREEPAPASDATEKYPFGTFQFWTWKVIWSGVTDIKAGEEFETMDRSRVPSYCWTASELDMSQQQ